MGSLKPGLDRLLFKDNAGASSTDAPAFFWLECLWLEYLWLECLRRPGGGTEAVVVPKRRPPSSSEEWTVVPRIESWDNSAGVHSRRNCPFSKALVGKLSQESRYPQPSIQNLRQNCSSSPNLWILSAKSEYMMNDRHHVHEQQSSTLARYRLYSVDAKS